METMDSVSEQISLLKGVAEGKRKISRVHLPYMARREENDEYYTPEKYIEMAREVMGEIGLDPASSDEAQKIIKANKYWTYVDDGLSDEKVWSGRIWLNPPYSRGLMTPFIDRFCEEWMAGHILEGIVLTYNSTDTRWCQRLLQGANAVCFPKGRIRFYGPGGGTSTGPLKGQMFTYFSHFGTDTFLRVFGELGTCFSK